VVTAPGQHVHRQGGRVRQLQEEDLLGRDVGDGGEVVATGQDVEAVQAHAHLGMIGPLHDPPGAAVVVDERPPGRRLEGEPASVRPCQVTEPGQLVGGHLVGVDRRRGDVAADQHRCDPEPVHQGELGLGPAQVAGEHRLGDTLGVAERLEEVHGQSEAVGQGPDLLGALLGRHQVRFEDLDAVETGRRAGVQLLDQAPAQTDRGDRGQHSALLGVGSDNVPNSTLSPTFGRAG